MAEMILPGTYIEVRAEGLIVPGRVTVGNIGIVGTASKGPLGEPAFVGSYVEARQRFGDYDAWIDGESSELTLVRALELAYAHGATTVIAVRVASSSAAAADYILRSASGPSVGLEAKSEGTWGNSLQVNISPADQAAMIDGEEHAGSGSVSLEHTPVLKSARNRIRLFTAGDGLTRSLAILYDDDAAAPGAAQVKIDRASGALTFGVALDPADRITASYSVDPASATKVTLRLGTSMETYTVVNGDDLVDDINKSPGGSAWVTATALANSGEMLTTSASITDFANFGTGSNTAGANGEDASDSDYTDGLECL